MANDALALDGNKRKHEIAVGPEPVDERRLVGTRKRGHVNRADRRPVGFGLVAYFERVHGMRLT